MATTRLTVLERQVLRCHGMPARDTARACHITWQRVMEIREDLRRRGAFPVSPAVIEAKGGQMAFESVDQLMRQNRGPVPRPTDAEIGWTLDTDPDGW